MAFVGRRAELGEVERLLDRAAGGSGAVLVVTGPPGAGKTALLEAGAERAARRGFEVLRASPSAGQHGRLVWAQLLGDVGAGAGLAARLLADAGPLELDSAARALASQSPRAIVVDDVDRGGPQCIEFLAVLATRAAAAPVVVLAAAPAPPGVGIELRLNVLGVEELGELVGERDPATRRAVWMASRGLPGVASALAADLRSLPVLRELRGATGLRGRPRKASPEEERARVNVTRTLRATIERIEATGAPRAAAHLRTSLRTGLACRYEPAPGGPARWRV